MRGVCRVVSYCILAFLLCYYAVVFDTLLDQYAFLGSMPLMADLQGDMLAKTILTVMLIFHCQVRSALVIMVVIAFFMVVFFAIPTLFAYHSINDLVDCPKKTSS